MTLECGAAQVDTAADLLQRLGAESVSVSSLHSEIMIATPVEEGYWQANRVSALLPPDVDVDILLTCLRNGLGAENILCHEFELLGDRDWVADARSGHGPMLFADRLCVCPSWAQPLPAPCTLVIDPGLAFGTGSHQTTALCLEWLARIDTVGQIVIDYGCGTGILGMAAARFGAERVQAVDTDSQALAAARENIHNNGLDARIALHPDDTRLEAADVLVANILLGPLCALAPRFADLVRSGGRIALSGLLASQVDACLEAYQPWFTMQEPEFNDEWAMLHGIRNV